MEVCSEWMKWTLMLKEEEDVERAHSMRACASDGSEGSRLNRGEPEEPSERVREKL
jgi:hypothetical protein